MTYRVPLPAGGRTATLDLVEPNTTAIQRFIRREGMAAYEPPTAAAVLAACDLANPGFVMYDVGANMGLYGALAASMFAPSHVHSFEPAPESARAASRIATRNRLSMTVHEVALSDSTGTAQLHLSPKSDASNSLVAGFRKTDDHLTVSTATLDQVVAQTGDAPDLIKIDVETHERAVLDGARATIERDRPAIVIEVLRRRGQDHGEEISEFFEGLNYQCCELSADPSWSPEARVRGSGTDDRDWLLVPDGLPSEFPQRWELWRQRWSECTVDRNPRVPLLPSVRAAYRRGGVREVAATAARYRQSRRREASGRRT